MNDKTYARLMRDAPLSAVPIDRKHSRRSGSTARPSVWRPGQGSSSGAAPNSSSSLRGPTRRTDDDAPSISLSLFRAYNSRHDRIYVIAAGYLPLCWRRF